MAHTGQKLNIGHVILLLTLCYLIITKKRYKYESRDRNSSYPDEEAGS